MMARDPMKFGAIVGLVVSVSILLVSCASDPQRLVETGNEYLEQGQYREAGLIYRRALQVDARNGEAYYRLGLAEYALGRYLQAFRAFIRAMDLQPTNNDAFEKLTDIYLASYDVSDQNAKPLLAELKEVTYEAEQNGIDKFLTLRVRGFIAMIEEREDEAVDLLRDALELRPGDQRVTIALADSYSSLARFDEAEPLLKGLVETSPQFGLAYESLYALYVRQGRLDDAEQMLLQASARNPNIALSWLQLGVHYHIMQRPDERDEAIRHLTSEPETFPNGYQAAADFYMRVGEFERAAALFEEGIGLHPEQKANYRLGAAQARALTGDISEALRQVELVLQDEPENDSAIVLRETLRLASGDLEVAESVIEELEKVLPRMPQNPVVNYNLGRAYQVTGQEDAALIQYQEAIRKRGDYVLPKLALGDLRIRRNEPADALNEADDVIAIQPGNLSARLLRANALIRLGQFDRAREEVSVLDSNLATQRQAAILEASIHAAEGEYGDAETILKELRSSNPSDRAATAGLVDLYLREGAPEKATALIETELETSPDSTDLRLVQARVSMMAREYQNAIREYETVLDAEPDDATVLLELGTAQYHTGNFDGAEARFRRARELAPKNAAASLQLALLLGEMGEEEETRDLLEEIVKLAPDNPVALNNLAYMLSETPQNIDRALVLTQRALKSAPDNPIILDTLGWIYIRMNQSTNAVNTYRRLIEIEPAESTWRYHYGMALFQHGDSPEAKVQLESALDYSPSTEESQEIRELLNRIG